MGRRAKPAKGKAEAKRPLARKLPKNDGASVSDLEKRLAEALEQQTATSEILRVISSSPRDIQPIFDTIAENARRLCDADVGAVLTYDGAMLHLVSVDNSSPERTDALRHAYPMPANTGHANGRAILTGRPVHIPDVREDRDYALGAVQLAGLRSVLSVPMLRGGTAIGSISVHNWTVPRPFSDNQITLLQTFAHQAVIAIESVRLFNETKESLEQQTATAEILRVISISPTDLQPVFDAVAESAARLCESLDAAIFRREGDRMRLVANHGSIPVGPIGEFSVSLVRGTVTGRCVLDGRAVHVADVQTETVEFPESSENAQQLGHRTILAVPIMREAVAIGAIALRRTEPRPFTDKQIGLLKTFADQAVIAIENVRLFTELKASNRELTTALEQQTATAEILRVISSTPADTQPVFDAIVNSTQRLMAGKSTVLLLRRDPQFVVRAYAGPAIVDLPDQVRVAPLDREQNFPSRAILDAEIVHVPDWEADDVPEHERVVARSFGIRAGLMVPLLREGQGIGALVVTRSTAGPYDENEIALLRSFADQAVIAIENARLLTELQTRTAELTRSVDELTALGDVSRALSSTLDLETVLQTIVLRANELAATAGCTIWEYDEAGAEFRLRASHYADQSDAALLQAPGGVTTIPKGQGVTTRVMERRQPVQIPDLLT
jgi:two-component system, NtrC family, sensor kinase